MPADGQALHGYLVGGKPRDEKFPVFQACQEHEVVPAQVGELFDLFQHLFRPGLHLAGGHIVQGEVVWLDFGIQVEQAVLGREDVDRFGMKLSGVLKVQPEEGADVEILGARRVWEFLPHARDQDDLFQ